MVSLGFSSSADIFILLLFPASSLSVLSVLSYFRFVIMILLLIRFNGLFRERVSELDGVLSGRVLRGRGVQGSSRCLLRVLANDYDAASGLLLND